MKRESQNWKGIFLRFLAHDTQNAHLFTDMLFPDVTLTHFPQEILENIHDTTK